jgi:hypothetical protein
MEKKIIYGVFAVDIELPEMTNKKVQFDNIAETMKSVVTGLSQYGKFVAAFERLAEAVMYCYDANGWLISRTNELPENVKNGKTTQIYYPAEIEVNKQ